LASTLTATSASLCDAGGIAARAASGNDLVFDASNSTEASQTFVLTTDQLRSATSLRFVGLSNASTAIVVNVVGPASAVTFSNFAITTGTL
jgi:choice-of-anchor A domain-containing protein